MMASRAGLATTVFLVQLHLLVAVEARVILPIHLPAARAEVVQVQVVLRPPGHQGQLGKVVLEETLLLLLHSRLAEVAGLGL